MVLKMIRHENNDVADSERGCGDRNNGSTAESATDNKPEAGVENRCRRARDRDPSKRAGAEIEHIGWIGEDIYKPSESEKCDEADEC